MVKAHKFLTVSINKNSLNDSYKKTLLTFSHEKADLVDRLVREGKLSKLDVYNQHVPKELLLDDYRFAMGLDTDEFELVARV